MSFSIDTSSSYGSIFDHSKALKQRQDAQKTNFANAFIKEQALKANDISNANLQSIAKEMVLQEALSSKSNSSSNNNDIESSAYSNAFKSSIYALKFRGTEGLNSISSTNSAYGYSVDNEGFMGADFNKAAGLPENFKVHKSTLEAIEDYNQSVASHIIGGSKYYDSFDMASIVNTYYNNFEKVIGSNFSTDKTSFNQKDLDALPKGFSKEKVYNITNVFRTDEQMQEAISLSGAIYDVSLIPHKFDFSPNSFKQKDNIDTANFNPDMSVYSPNENGEYSKEALFMSFLKSVKPEADYTMATYSSDAKAYLAHSALENIDNFQAKSFSMDEIMSGKVNIAELLKSQAQIGLLDMSIYAYENNISWKSSAEGYGSDFPMQFLRAQANGYKPSAENTQGFISSMSDRLLNLANNTRVA